MMREDVVGSKLLAFVWDADPGVGFAVVVGVAVDVCSIGEASVLVSSELGFFFFVIIMFRSIRSSQYVSSFEFRVS